MTTDSQPQSNGKDPTLNVRELVNLEVERIDDLRKAEVKRIDEKIDANNEKYQIQFNDSKEAVAAALIANKEAINKAEQANEKRFDAVNEFRATLGDQQQKLLTRTEYDSAHRSLIEKIDGVTDRINRTEGASGVYVTQTDLNNAIDRLQSSIEATLRPVVAFMNSQTGKSTGLNLGWVVFLGGSMGLMAFVAMVLSIIRFFVK